MSLKNGTLIDYNVKDSLWNWAGMWPRKFPVSISQRIQLNRALWQDRAMGFEKLRFFAHNAGMEYKQVCGKKKGAFGW